MINTEDLFGIRSRIVQNVVIAALREGDLAEFGKIDEPQIGEAVLVIIRALGISLVSVAAYLRIEGVLARRGVERNIVGVGGFVVILVVTRVDVFHVVAAIFVCLVEGLAVVGLRIGDREAPLGHIRILFDDGGKLRIGRYGLVGINDGAIGGEGARGQPSAQSGERKCKRTS